MKKKPLPCNGYPPSRPFLFDSIAAGCVTPDMGSRAVHNNYKDTVRFFKLPGMEYSSGFASRITGLWKIVVRDISQSSNNKQALEVSICNHPPLITEAEVSLSGIDLRRKYFWVMTLKLEIIKGGIPKSYMNQVMNIKFQCKRFHILFNIELFITYR